MRAEDQHPLDPMFPNTMNPETNIPPEKTVRDFVKLTLGKTRFLLPDREVLSIEPILNIDLTHEDNDDFNFITMNDKKISVYAFDEDLQLVSAKDYRHQFCVFLDDGQDRIGILCDDAGKVTLDDIKLHELPDCMLSTDTAIQNIAVSNNNLYCVSNFTNLLQLIKNSSLG